MPALPVAAPTTRAPHHLDPLLARGARTSAQDNFKPAYHNDSMGVALTSYAHSVTPTECAYGVETMVVRSLRYQHLQNSITSLTAAADRGAAVAAHVRRGRGYGV